MIINGHHRLSAFYGEQMYLAKNILKAELIFREVSHLELSQKLNKIGLNETKASIDNKLSRGTFSADFFLSSMIVIGASEVELKQIKKKVGLE